MEYVKFGRAVRVAASVMVFSFAVHSVCGGTFYVSPDGDDSAAGTSDAPFMTIAAGVTAASASSEPREVIVRSGTYRVDAPIELTNATLVRSETGNPDDVIVDGQGSARLVRWTKNNSSVLSGITFRNGFSRTGNRNPSDLQNTAPYATAGLFLMDGGIVSNCVVTGCVLTGNGEYHAYGAGIYANGSRIRIADTHVYGNVVSNDCPGATAKDTLGGGIYVRNNGKVVGCVVEENLAWVRSQAGEWSSLSWHVCSGGGIYACEGCEISGCTIRGNRAVNASSVGYTGSGGGVSLNDGSVVSDCLVYGNSGTGQGGGVAAFGSAVIRCTVTNNALTAVATDAAKAAWLCGGGVFLYGDGAKCLNSRVDRNSITGLTAPINNSMTSGGGGIAMCGVSNTVADCSVSGNSAHCGGAFLVGGACNGQGKDCVVSNCHVYGNSSLHSQGAGTVHFRQPDGVLFTDCVVVSNTAAGRGIICYGTVDGPSRIGLVFRNTFFFGNTNGYALFEGDIPGSHSLPLTVENCTVADNRLENRMFRTTGGFTNSGIYESNLVCRSNVFYGNLNENGALADFANPNSTLVTTNAWWNFVDKDMKVRGKYLDCSEPEYGNHGTVEAADFAGADTGDYRLARSSDMIDRGGPVRDWMGGRSRKDMGDGTVTVSADGVYGVKVTRDNAVCRVKNLPEPGCFEVWWPTGLIFGVR